MGSAVSCLGQPENPSPEPIPARCNPLKHRETPLTTPADNPMEKSPPKRKTHPNPKGITSTQWKSSSRCFCVDMTPV